MTPKQEKFYKKYKQLCKKHGLMIISPGEQVIISEYDASLWYLKDATERDAEWREHWKQKQIK